MRKIILLLLPVLIALPGFCQTVFSNPITGVNPNVFNPYTEGQSVDMNLTVSGIGRGSGITGSNATNRYNASGWTTLGTPDENDYFEFTLTPLAGYAIHFSGFVYTGQASASGPVNFAFRSSLDGFASNLGSPLSTGSTIDLSAPVYQNIATAITFRLYGWGGSSTSGTFSINDFSFTGIVTSTGPPAPSISILSSLTMFSSVSGQASPVQTYTVSGSNLTGNIIIQASSGFEISFSENTGFSNQLVLIQSGGNAGPALIYARQNSFIPGNNNGIISHGSDGAQTKNIALTGRVLAMEPTLAPTVSFSNVAVNSFDIHFTGGNGSSRLVVMRQGSAVASMPIDGINYTANSLLGSGTMIASGEYVVYNGTGNTAHVTGLTGNTGYFISVFEYNDDGVPEASNYLSTGGTGNQFTIAAPEGVQLMAVNTLVTIDFDNTVNYASNGQFEGTGFSSNPLPGQLNSASWSATGWSDGELSFNETRTTGDFARGITLSHPATGGIYAFEPFTPGNRALGIQPGTGDWAPGTLTLRIRNQTGFDMHSLGIAYKLFVYNNADRSSSFLFSYSTDNINYIPVTQLDYISPSAADPSPSWVINERSIEITGISIVPGGYFYIRWSSADVSGSGSRDEFALDDIGLIANPVAGSPLPVRFTSLKAVQRNHGIEVEFSNATEENLVGYEIERSSNGRIFQPIKKILPSKNDGGRAVYSVIDDSPNRGDNFYRVRSEESTGNVSYSNIIRINIDRPAKELVLYPNPIRGTELGIQISHLNPGQYQIKIFNSAGAMVMIKSVDHPGGAITQYLTVSHLPPGWYNVQFEGGVPVKKQFIIQ